MYEGRQTIWQLVRATAQELTSKGQVPFTRGNLISGVQATNPHYGPDSINPIIQGLTDNLRGGASGAVGKKILHSVGRGLFVLHPRFGKAPAFEPVAKNCRPASMTVDPGVDSISLDGFRFAKVCEIQVEQDAQGRVQEFLPQERYDNWRKLDLNPYGAGPFCKFKVPAALNLSGVYALLLEGQPVYIGECERLSDRFNMGYGNVSPRNCYKGGQETNCRVNSLIRRETVAGNAVCLYFFATEKFKQVEHSLRQSMRPVWNKV